jgi:AraC-like DNA-binding protein
LSQTRDAAKERSYRPADAGNLEIGTCQSLRFPVRLIAAGMVMNKPGASQSNREEAPALLRPAEAKAPDRLQLSTRALRERDRFEVYRENFNQYVYQAEVENRSEGRFECEIEVLKAGNVRISRIIAPPTAYARTRRHVSDFDETLTLFVGVSQGLTIEQADIRHELRGGNGFLYHGSMPGEAEAVSSMELLGIKVPAARIMNGLAAGRRLTPMPIAAELPAMRLITQYLNSFSTVANSSDLAVREAFGTHLVDLLMLVVGTDRDTLELIKGRGLKAARTETILNTIGRDFASMDLSADKIGLLLGITGRQVHRLLQETPKTFHEHLLERRLVEARRLLTDPSCGVLNLAEIARRAGFVDRSIASSVPGSVRRRPTCVQTLHARMPPGVLFKLRSSGSSI